MKAAQSKALASVLGAAILTATAAPAHSDPYITLQGGANFVPNLKLKEGGISLNGQFEPGWSGGAALGYAFGNGFAVEIEGLHAHAPLESLNGLAADGDLATTSAMVNLLYAFSPVTMFGDWSFKPYVGGGAGAIFVEMNENGARGSDTVWGYQLRGGLRYEVNAALSVQAEYRWQHGANAEFTLRGLPSNEEIRSNSVLAGVTYRFR